MFQIVKRKLTDSESKLVVKEIKSTPYIVGYSLSEWIKAENILVAEDDIGNLLGVCLTYDFHKDWCKIAALFVLNDFRGLGIGKTLFYRSVRDALERGKNVYTISANPIVIQMMKKFKFRLFKNVFDLQNSHKDYYLYFYIHHIIWTINLYRIKEIIRKKIVYKSSEYFIFGTLLHHS